MEIDKKYQIEKAAGEDPNRPDIQYIHISQHRATATNGRILATVPCVTAKSDELGPITVDSLLYARDHIICDVAVLHLLDNRTVIALDSSQLPRSLESTASPNAEQLDMFRKSTENVKPIQEITAGLIPTADFDDIVLAINPALLLDLAKALGSKEKLILRLRPDADNQVRQIIRCEADKDAYGVIMPMNVHEGEKPVAMPFKEFCRKNNVTVTVSGDKKIEVKPAVLKVADELIEKATTMVRYHKHATLPLVKSQLGIDEGMAAAVIDVLIENGVIGKADKDGDHKVLATKEE
jgi:hypothetical protein